MTVSCNVSLDSPLDISFGFDTDNDTSGLYFDALINTATTLARELFDNATRVSITTFDDDTIDVPLNFSQSESYTVNELVDIFFVMDYYDEDGTGTESACTLCDAVEKMIDNIFNHFDPTRNRAIALMLSSPNDPTNDNQVQNQDSVDIQPTLRPTRFPTPKPTDRPTDRLGGSGRSLLQTDTDNENDSDNSTSSGCNCEVDICRLKDELEALCVTVMIFEFVRDIQDAANYSCIVNDLDCYYWLVTLEDNEGDLEDAEIEIRQYVDSTNVAVYDPGNEIDSFVENILDGECDFTLAPSVGPTREPSFEPTQPPFIPFCNLSNGTTTADIDIIYLYDVSNHIEFHSFDLVGQFGHDIALFDLIESTQFGLVTFDGEGRNESKNVETILNLNESWFFNYSKDYILENYLWHEAMHEYYNENSSASIEDLESGIRRVMSMFRTQKGGLTYTNVLLLFASGTCDYEEDNTTDICDLKEELDELDITIWIVLTTENRSCTSNYGDLTCLVDDPLYEFHTKYILHAHSANPDEVTIANESRHRFDYESKVFEQLCCSLRSEKTPSPTECMFSILTQHVCPFVLF